LIASRIRTAAALAGESSAFIRPICGGWRPSC
jgi:hypothetical protein